MSMDGILHQNYIILIDGREYIYGMSSIGSHDGWTLYYFEPLPRVSMDDTKIYLTEASIWKGRAQYIEKKIKAIESHAEITKALEHVENAYREALNISEALDDDTPRDWIDLSDLRKHIRDAKKLLKNWLVI